MHFVSGTYTNLNYHFVFSTKNREPIIDNVWRETLYEYIGGIVRSEGGVLYRIGGMPDHLHLLINWQQTESLSNLMCRLKAHSSKWVHETFPALRHFAWQDGYAVFSVSKSQCDVVARYIDGQTEHHKKCSFLEELALFLKKHDVEYNSEYIGR